MPLEESDTVLIQVICRELERLIPDAEPSIASVLGMTVALLGSIGPGQCAAAPALARELDLAALKRRLLASNLIDPASELHATRSLSGFSKDTFLVNVDAPAETSVIVVRRDLPAGTTRTTVVDEYPILKRLATAGFPVAEPLLVETDEAVLGQPFIVVRGLPGQIDFPTWQTDPKKRAEGALQLARFLARLHSEPLDGLPFNPAAGRQAVEVVVRDYITEWRAMWRECRPALGWEAVEEAYAWLLGAVPRSARRAAVVHGDIGYHNILMQDAQITGVVDWEFCHLGDPAEDLSYCRPAVETIASWDWFIQAYREAGGEDCPPDRLEFYNVWRGVRNATCCAVGISSFKSGLNNDLKLAYAGRILLKTFAEDVEEQLRLIAPNNKMGARPLDHSK